MKRINVFYGGTAYSLADADYDELKAKLLDVHASGQPLWLHVNDGEGSYREVDILVAPGISVAVAGIDAD